MQQMKGKVCFITGATSGIGKVTALELAKMGATVIVVARDRKRGENTIIEIKNQSGNQSVHLMIADLSSQRSVRQLAEEFKASYDRIDVLVNNAGAVFGERTLTSDGIEQTFALNHLGYFLLTDLLLDRLKSSAPSRIINVSSMAHVRTNMNFDDLYYEKGYRPFTVYSQSKLANVLFTYELARRLEGTGVTVNCLHPGVVGSNFGQSGSKIIRFFYKTFNWMLITPEKGADTLVYLASSPEVEGISGKYFVKRKAKKTSSYSYDLAAAKRLWDISERLTYTN